MKDSCPKAWQHARLVELRDRLAMSLQVNNRSTLATDGCGDWALWGRKGHIYAVPEGCQLVVTGMATKKRWTFAKQALTFCRLWQDGDDEGTLFLEHAPGPAEAGVIRKIMGLRRRGPPPMAPFVGRGKFERKPAIGG